MSAFEVNSWVWIEDETERYLPAKVLTPFTKGTATKVLTEDGEERNLTAAESSLVSECNSQALESNIEDLVEISDLNEMSILHILRNRFKEDKIYTNISSILISVNPFKLLPLYTPEVLDRYRGGYRGNPPHVFGIAYNAYNNMLAESHDQSVVISGESGAGKSEATKLILQFVTDVSARANGVTLSSSSGGISSLEQQILAANPILEAFGNAKTLRNNNSSRFGKLITVNFDKSGSIVGGGIINYLLEKSRVVYQTQGERNYHIFYQLLSASDTNPALATELKLQDPELFQFTGTSGVIHIEGVSDEKEFEDLQNSFNILRFSPQEQKEVFKIIAGVLHLGNAKYAVEKKSNQEDGCQISTPDVTAHVANMWSIDPTQLEKFLCARFIGTRSVILVSYNIQQGQETRDATVKRVYAELFQLMVNKINAELSGRGVPRHNFIGVLDIFGFESFEVNSFEQLCINFCNEKLQFHFNEHIFKMEQTLYAAEGILIPGSSFVDNQPTLDLLELRATGIFSMCDNEIIAPKGSDEGLLNKILKMAEGASKHPNLQKPKPRECKDHLKNFGVLHYAGLVFYNISGFLEKNKDQLHSDMVGVLRSSTSPLIQAMFPPDEESSAPGGGRGAPKGKSAQKTLGGQFKNQLNELISTLNATHPHFVRCMKSNDQKIGNIFAAGRMQDQLRYAGLVEVCRIRKLGFPVRRPFDEFFKRYRCCDLLSPGLDALIATLRSRGALKDGEWAKGNTRIFMRTQQNIELEVVREVSLVRVTVVVQKYVRRFIMQRKRKNWFRLIAALRESIEKREDSSLTAAIENSSELPFGGKHLAPYKAASELLKRVREEKRITNLLENAISSMELNTLKSALAAHAAVNPPFVTPLSSRATELVTRIEAELACKAGLNQGISARDIKILTEFIDRAHSMNLLCNELEQAIALKARIEKEEDCLQRLLATMQVTDISSMKLLVAAIASLEAMLNEAMEMGLEAREEYKKGKKLLEEMQEDQRQREIEEQRKMEEAARAAAAAAAQRAREEAAERQRQAEELARQKRESAIADATKALFAARETKNIAEINRAIQNAIEVGLDSQSAEVVETQTLLARLKQLESFKSQIVASLDVLSGKLDTGLSNDDLISLRQVLASAQSQGFSSNDLSEIANANESLSLFEKHVKAKSDLTIAIETKDRVKLREALDLAENLDMKVEVVEVARTHLKDLETAHRKANAAADAPPPEPYDAAEEQRQKRQELAKQAKFDIKNCPQLRTADDFARGAILNKGKIKESFMAFQNNVIPKSLTDLNKDLNKTALQIHKDLLGYMGDKQMPFPAMLAQDILRKGFEMKQIRDEIYLQIIKQLTSNPRPESVAKGWQIMCMCVGTFPPSFEFENYLLHYILEKRDKGRGAVVDYAKYCLRTLEAMIGNGDGSGFVPSVEEILAYKERPPILATIHLVDGNVITEDLPLTPDLNVGKVLEMCAGWLDLKDVRVNTLGIFVYDLGEIEGENPFANAPYADLIRTPRPLRNEDFLGDVVVQKARQKRKFKFVLKKKIFLPSHNYRGEDPFYERMLYLQAEDEAIIQGNVEIFEEQDVSILASISMAVAFGAEMGGSIEELMDSEVLDFVCPSWRERKPVEEWAAEVLTHRDTLVVQESDELQDQFLRLVQKSPQYGTHWFYCHKIDPATNAIVPHSIEALPTDILLAFNSEGMHIYDHNRNHILSFPFADIYRWGGSSSQFSLIMADESLSDSFEFVVTTSQAADMAAVILDHIRAIMAEQEQQE